MNSFLYYEFIEKKERNTNLSTRYRRKLNVQNSIWIQSEYRTSNSDVFLRFPDESRDERIETDLQNKIRINVEKPDTYIRNVLAVQNSRFQE